MAGPGDVPVAETTRFLTEWLPPAPARVVDVGCGTGEIAAHLMTLGYQVEGLDTDPAIVAAAQRGGVRAVVATWPFFVPDDPQAILFVHTLHHVEDLDLTLTRCLEVLPSGGAVVVEDFAFADMPVAARAWFSRWVEHAADAGLLRSDLHPYVAQARGGPAMPPPDHGHHSASAMEAAIGLRFSLRLRGVAPYFYRYMAKSVANSAAGRAFVDRMRLAEEKGIAEKGLWPLGRRWVGTKRTGLLHE